VNLREKIIHETLRLFSLKGFSSTSIHDILQAAGASKGGLYNYFKSKDELFFAVLDESRKIWREKNLDGLDGIEDPIEKIVRLLQNYKDRYLKDSDNFPGGCVFVTLAVELPDHLPHLAGEVTAGFVRLKAMLNRLLDQAREAGKLKDGVNTQAVTDMIFSGMLGTSVMYGMDKSPANLDRNIGSIIEHLKGLTR
jgi:AcrR family transcriptional regulator